MDVTKSVFKRLKPQIEAAIQNCSFAAIDCEFTGLVLPDPLHPLDTVAQRYQKLRAGISEYLVVQVGLSLWLFDEDKQRYNVKTFNFFTFPDAKYPHRFRNQASCLQFLVQHGFDLNRCVREGLPFLHPQDLLEQRQRLESRHIDELALLLGRDRGTIRDLVNSTRGTSDAALPEIKEPSSPIESVSGLDSSVQSYIENVNTMLSQWMRKTLDQDSILLPACNDVVRLSVYRHIEKKFFDSFFQMEAVRPEAGDQRNFKHIKLSRSDSTPLQRLFAKQKEERELLEERFGVSAIVKKLVDSRKPVVGHNSIRDLLHVIHQFIAPLPEDFAEFQNMCKDLFPVLFDTKHMSLTGNIKSSIRGTRLIDVFNQIKNQHDRVFPIPKIHIEKGFGYDENLAREHEAGFDAWLTGYIFAAFAHSVAPSQRNVFSKLDFSHSSFKPYLNKLHFGPSLDISTMELDATPAALHRNDVFVIEWKEPEDHVHARHLLAQVGGSKRNGWGELVLAFVPSNSENCVKVMREREGTVNSCRLYKFQPSKQSRRRKAKSKSPTETNAGTTTSGNANSAVTSRKSAPGSTREDGIHQYKPWSPPSTVSGVDQPKKPKLDSISVILKASSPVRQSGPFPEASW